MNGLQLFEFEKEIYVWSKLKHPNVLPLLGYAFDADTGYPMLISPWMERAMRFHTFGTTISPLSESQI